MPTLEKNYLRYVRTHFSLYVNTLVLLYLILSNLYENCVSGKDKVGIYRPICSIIIKVLRNAASDRFLCKISDYFSDIYHY